MHDAGSNHAVNRGQALSAVVHHRVDKRPGIVADRRMDDHAFRFIDHQHIVILIDDLQRDILCLDFELFRLRDTKLDAISGYGQIFLFGAAFAVYRQIPVFDQLLDKAA